MTIFARSLAGPNRNGLPEGGGYHYRGTKLDHTDAPPLSIISRSCPVCAAPPGMKCRRADGQAAQGYHKSRRQQVTR